MIDFELAPFAVDENKSRGRLHQESYDDSKYRSVFGRDRDRIINSSAFRRLQYKTQVFVNHEGDHFRTRLTHSLEVAQIARWIAGALKVNKDLAEIVSLSHDLGHSPFGHAGEDALNAKMQDFCGQDLIGFSHNVHALKIITKLETRYIEFEGLNLSWEMLEGVVKHNGPISREENAHFYIQEYNSRHDLDLHNFSSIESQISAISDDIAYNNHDIEDGLRANLFKVEDLFFLPVIGKIYQDILQKYPTIKRELLVGEAKKRLTLEMVMDVIKTTESNLAKNNIKSENDVRNASKFMVHFSPLMNEVNKELKKFLMEHMYRHSTVNRMTSNAHKIVAKLFDFYIENPNCLPDDYSALVKESPDQKSLAIIICDYIAGMTDRYAIKEFEELI